GAADGLPVAAAGAGPPDAAVGAADVDVAEAVGGEGGGAAGDVAGAAAGVGVDVAVAGVVGVVDEPGDVLPAAARVVEGVLREPGGRVGAGVDHPVRRGALLRELRGALGDLVRLLTALVVRGDGMGTHMG